MLQIPRDRIHIAPHWRDDFAAAGLHSPQQIFHDPRIRVWRKLPERENATLDLPSGRRLHVKRFASSRGYGLPAFAEVRGWLALGFESIPTLELVSWGSLTDGRSFTLAADLTGYRSAQQLLRDGVAFDDLASQTAHLAARLHARGLHHQDLYLCHFFLREADLSDARLIDVGRVRRLPGFLFAKRWVVKDLAQFRYSAREFDIPEARLNAWLDTYAAQRSEISNRKLRAASLLKSIERKTRLIARHDEHLRARQPARNISIPDAQPDVTPSGDHPTPSGDHPTPSGDHPTPSGDHPTPSGDHPGGSSHHLSPPVSPGAPRRHG